MNSSRLAWGIIGALALIISLSMTPFTELAIATAIIVGGTLAALALVAIHGQIVRRL